METVTELLSKLASKGVKLSAEAGRLNCYAPQGTLTSELKDGIVRYKSEILSLLEERQDRLPVRGDRDVARFAPPVPKLGEAEKHRLLVDFNASRVEYRNDQCLHELFVEQVALHSAETAVVCADRQLTYQQLYDRSRDLALYLQSLGVGPDSRVGLCMERSLEMVVGLMGILQAGGAYVPLDTEFPDDRVAYMLRDSQAAIVLTQGSLEEKLGALIPAGMQLIALDRQWPEIAARVADGKAKGVALQQQVTPQHLAYVMYTSGSTGRPKGVMVEHRQLVSYVTAIQNKLRIPEGSAFALASTFAADLGNTVLFPSLLGGGTLHVLSREAMTDADCYAAYCRKHRIDCMKVTPSHLQALVGEGSEPCLVPARTLVMGGEVLSRGVVELVRRLNPECRIYNHYGPTECSVGVLCGEVAAEHPGHAVPLGAPLGGTRIYILDEQQQPVPIGVAGELYIGGVQVARGYLNQPELTAERFLRDPFHPEPGARVYRTGDVARWLDDGTVEYFGRNDFQVKIRGFRVELGEVEAQLARHPGVKEAVVLAREDEPGEKRLVAYVTGRRAAVGVEELRSYMQAAMPHYMVPAAFVELAAMPLTPNGKVDRRALPRPAAEAYASQEYEPPQGEIEEALGAIWQELLHLERVGRNDNFFELGGDSLLAMRLISKVRSRLHVDVALNALFERGSVARFAELITAETATSDIPPIVPVDRAQYERLPLSFAQERVWFFDQLEPGSAGYNLPSAFTISGALDVGQLEEAFRLIIARHENLRTVFPVQDGQARQVILERLDFALERVDLSHCEDREARDRQAREIGEADAVMPFDLARGPLLRGKVIQLAEQEHLLLLNVHHIISDGWSMSILVRELGLILDALGQGRQPELAALPIQYADYSVWQRTWLEESGTLARQLAYWQEKLAGAPETLELAADYARPSVQSFAGARHTFHLDAHLAGQLRSLAGENGGTLYMVLLAAFKTLVHRYTGQSDICIGSAIANRQHAETEGLIGMFVNTLALRSEVAGDDSFVALLARVKATCLEAYEHQDAPFEKVVDSVRPQRNLAVSPIFQLLFILQNAAEVEPADGRFRRCLLETGVSKFDLTATFTETADGLAGSFEYSTALYEPQTIERLAAHFTALCRAIAETPAAKIRDLGYLGEAETRRLLVDFNDTRIPYAKDRCLHELFAARAARHPERTAVVCGEVQFTYQQLGDRSRALALYLQAAGVGPESLVGLCLERSADMVVGLFGILQAGGGYVPLDPEYPDDRLAYMLEDSGAAIVLTHEALRPRLSALLPAGTRLVALDAQWPEIASHAGAALRQDVAPHHLAYVMYTSGSTGRPKGVMVEHGQIVSYVTAIQNKLQVPECSSFALASTFAADLGNTVLFPALLGGGTLHVLGRETMTDADRYAEYCRRHRIDCMKVTPSHLQALVGDGVEVCRVPAHTLVTGGEVLSRGVVELVRRLNPECRIFNHYGPTECSVGVLCGEVSSPLEDSRRSIPLGSPLGGSRIYILDAQKRPVPVGVAGELYIGGAQVARGYLHQPELTAERFVDDPFQAGSRMYRTGDVARWRDDGTVEYFGRNDFQVKIRGFRIELGEVEAQLARHPGVKEVVVLAREDQPGEKRLVAYVTATGESLAIDELRAHMQSSVPQYMVPAAFVVLEALPLTPNGKVDRRALPKPEADAYAREEYEAPQGEVEETLAAIWRELLHVERVGRTENFFELGGHSLLATRLISRIRTRLNVDVPLKALFERPSVARFAELIAGTSQSDIPPIVPVDRTRYERLPLSFAQERVWFFDQLEPGGAVYNMPRAVTIRGELDVEHLDRALNVIIARHEILRTVFPSQDGKAHQRILDGVELRLERVDLSRYADGEARSKAQEICQAEAAQPFDLVRGPLFRGTVIRLAEREHILVLCMHHIISDGWSLGVLIKELGSILEAFREGRQPELAPLPIQYADYSVWQRAWLEGGDIQNRQLAYWQQKLAGVPESLDLVTDYPRPPVQSFAGATQTFTIDAQLTEGLKALAQRAGGTLYMVLLAAFKSLLHRYTGQSDICVGSPIANRQYGETEGLIGMFANTLALRSRVEADEPFSTLLSQVKATCLEAYEHQDAPFEKIVDVVRPQRNLAVSPIFQVMVILQNADIGTLDQRFPRLLLDSVVSKFDLTASFTEKPEGMSALIEYSTALYKPQTISRLIEHFIALCRSIVATPAAKIRDLDFLGEAETRRLLVDFNATQADYPAHQCLHELFVERVPLQPEKAAVVCGDRQLSYQQLYERSRDLALFLQAQGVGPDRLVGVCMERSLDMIAGMLGILQAGGAYVPLDPDYPADRLAYMVQDSQAAIVLTQESLLDHLRALVPAGTQLIALDRQWPEVSGRVAELKASGVALQQTVAPHHLAYVIYTSGSTGQPKGVAIEHHSPVTLVYWASGVYSREELAGVLASTSICFDLSVYEIFVTLAHGGTIVLVPNALGLIDLPNKEAVTLINTVPSAMEELVRLGAIPGSVQTINLAGEPLSPVLVEKIYGTTPAKKVYDLYGPSEDTTYSTYVLREPGAAATIGRPIANTEVYILDAHQRLQPVGVPGELHIAGDGLARGYLNRPELTEGRFVANPFRPGTRMYKTGDLARWLDDGTLQYLGRIDTQVKIRGFRIELGEIEARLQQHYGIQDSAVVAQDHEGGKQLIAFYRAKETTAEQLAELPFEDLRAHLLQKLPEHMIPAAFVSLAAIPLNPNGKVDRRALSRMDVTIASGRDYVAPRNDAEKQLVEIWAGVLKLAPEQIGIHDNFFELGGHSLLATQLIAKIRSRLNLDLPLKAVFERSTIARFAELIPDRGDSADESRHAQMATQLMAKLRSRLGSDSPLKALLDQASVAELAELIAEAEESDVPAIRPVDRSKLERLPLSFAQERLWFVTELEPDSAIYNIPVAVTIRGELDLDQLDRALNLIIERHENLRTVFPSAEGQARQRILERLDFRLDRRDVSHGESKDARDAAVREICRLEAATPFDLGQGPLFRATAIKLAGQEHVLLFNMHHIISDGWSLGVLIKELGSIMDAFRQGRRPELPALPVQYADYSIWQRTRLEEGGILKRQLAYWQEKLAGVPESLDLMTDYPRPSVQSFAGATHAFTFDAQLSAQLRSMSQQQGGTLFMILLAAFKALLHRYTGQTDICIGSPIANRQQAETQELIGLFVNTLALRSQVGDDDTFASLLSRVKATCLEAYEHQDTPFEKIVDMLHPQRSLAVSPIFQVMFILQNADMGARDERFPRYPLDSGISKYDLTASFTETAEGLTGAIEYSTALYKPQTIERMAEHFVALCRAIAATPGARVGELDFLGKEEKHRLLVEYNATQAGYPADQCLHELFVAQAALHADKTAVVCGDERLTYRQLLEKSQDLALYLQAQGVGPDGLVGVCMERSLDMIAGMLGILQAGGAYVPLDPDYPEDRLAYMLQDSQASIVLTQETLRDKLSASIPAATRVIALDRQWPEIADRVAELEASGVSLQQQVEPHHLAYVIYTSGSTGQPKGVAIEHHSPVTLVHWASEVYSREELACVLASTSICFDLSVYEIFVTLANGGTITLVPNALGLIDLSEQASITLINTVPSAMEELVRQGSIPASVQTINLAGEPLARALVDRIYTTTSAGKVYDLYGPSEDTTYSTYVLRQPDAPATIGRPIANTQVYILDARGRLQPIGVPGELHIAGDGLCRGYLHRPQLTQEKFIPNPFVPGTRMYKTGDLARWLDDGTLQYLGRIDTQVKVRGFRIELGEIEARLTQHSAVQDAAVIAQGEGANKQLIAFYRAKDTTAEQVVPVPDEELRAHLLRSLPDYMVPAAFVSLAAIPLNPNGKVDRRALARMDVTIASAHDYVAPRTDAEKQLVEIWSEVLKLAPETIGVNDSFFELGGHSLLATRLMSKIRSRLNINLPLKALFERTTVALLAELFPDAAKSDIPPIRPVDRATLDRLPLSFAQERLWFFDQLEPGSVRYNITTAVTITGELDVEQVEEACRLIIARHENLRTVFPSEDGQAQQLILDDVDFRLERADLSDAGEDERDARAKEMCRADAAKPFDLAHGPLVRGKVIRLAEQEHILALNMHHIISDGWSTAVLLRELRLNLAALREGRRPELAPLPIQYADYSVWQRAWLEEGGVLERQLGYWRKKLADVPETLDLVTDYPRPSVQSVAGAAHPFTLDAQLTAELKRLAEQRGGTLYMILLAAFKVLLHRYTSQQDLCVGSLIANRQYAETENLIGLFFNTLALRSQVEGDDTFSAFLSQVRATCLEAYEHQDAPWEKVVDMLRPQRNLASSPIFQVMVVLHNVETGKLDERMHTYSLEQVSSQFDLSAAFIEKPEGAAGYLVYSTALFKPQTIARMAEHFTALCRAIVANPTARLRELDYIGEAEKQLLAGFNDTRADYPKDPRIHDFFADQVAAGPNRTAVVDGDRTLTYQELYDRSEELALVLQSHGVGPDSIVGLCLERSVEMMLGIMSTVRAGGAYLPADPSYPDDRLAYMLEDSQATIVLTQERFKARLESLLLQDATLIALDTEWDRIRESAAASRAQGVELRQDVAPGDVCYLIYTSGSTGKPKGVLVEHQALVNRIHWMQKAYQLTPDDVVLQKTPYSFDVSVWEFFWPMMTGSSLVFAAPEGHKDVRYLETLISEAQVTTLHFVPSMLHAYLDNATGHCDSVLRIFCSGEALDRKSVDRYKKRFPNAELHNLYGPTEAAIDVTAYDCAQLPYAYVPIGAPIDNIQIHILDAHDQLQPIGVPGELHIAGDGLARGYINRAELTKERFVANPFTPGARMYKTGDLARWLDDGNVQYLGRIDTQVKIRGFRIETGEIEAQLNQHPRIKDSAVIAQGQDADKQLIAFYQTAETRADHIVQVPYEELRAHLLRTLPEFMVPAAFVSLAEIPLNSSGKVDRRALSRMDVRIVSGEEYVAPRDDRERQLAGIWAQVLNRSAETIGVNDNFFELGGHSLLAVKLIERMRQQGMHTTLQALFTAPTLAKLAAVAESVDPVESIAAETLPDFEQEAVLDPAIVLRTEGTPEEPRNVLLTGATGFLGAFLLSDLLAETRARIYCLVRAAGPEAGDKRIDEHMRAYGLWTPALADRVVPVPGDLASPMLGLTPERFAELAGVVDAIYHNGATVNLYYPYSVLKAANVLGTEELLRLASRGRSKVLHFVSTLHVHSTRARDASHTVVTESDPRPDPRTLFDGYGQSKWVAEELVESAAARGIPVVTYRPSQIIGHSRTGAASLDDFVPSFIRGCLQVGCIPDAVVDNQLYLTPVDYVSRSIVAISKRKDVFGRVFNLTSAHSTPLQELLEHLLAFDPAMQRVSYETWKARLSADPDNALARFLGTFPDHVPEAKPSIRPRFDCTETLKVVNAAGIERPPITQQLFETYFSYLAEHTATRAVVRAN